MFKRFLKEKNGGLFEYIAIVAIAAVTVSMSFPGLRADVASWFSGTTSVANTGISGTTTADSSSTWSAMTGGASSGSTTDGSGDTSSSDGGSDSTPSVVCSTTEDFEDTSYDFTTSGTWALATDKYYQGTHSLKGAGNGTNNATVTETITMNVPSGYTGDLSFYYLVSSEQNFDFLTINLDGTQIVHVSGSGSWTNYTSSSLASGDHTLTLTYSKDPSVSTGSDAGYIDNLTLNLFGTGCTGSPSGSSSAYPLTIFEGFENPPTYKFTLNNAGGCAPGTSFAYQGSHSYYCDAEDDSDTTGTISFTIPSGHTGTLSFLYDGCGYSSYDEIYISLDGTMAAESYDCTGGWIKYTSKTLASGSHSLYIDFYADSTSIYTGGIDNLTLTEN